MLSLLQSPPVAPPSAARPVVEYQNQRVVLDAATLAALPRQTVNASDHGTSATFEGVLLRQVLTLAKVPVGAELRGDALCLVVHIEAADGYRAVFALAELDAGLRDRPIILADVRDGKPLPATSGPFQVIAADETKAGRWVRQVTRISVIPVSAGR